MKHSNLKLVWTFCFWMRQKSTWQMENFSIMNFSITKLSSQYLTRGHFLNVLCQDWCRRMFLDWVRTTATLCSCMFSPLPVGLLTLILFPPRIIFFPGRNDICRCGREDWSSDRILCTEYRPLEQALHDESEELSFCYALNRCTSDFAKMLKKLL